VTRFYALAHRSNADHPAYLGHTFLVETVEADEAARRARTMAQTLVRSHNPGIATDDQLWVFVCTISMWNGPNLTPDVREWQRWWLEAHAGWVVGDRITHAFNNARVFQTDSGPGPWWRQGSRR
jgi:hypothetical protein